MLIADAQVHIWAEDTPDRPWIEGGHSYAHMAEPLGADRLLAEMDRVGVDRALLVSPTWEGDRNDLVLEEAHRRPDRFGAIVRFALPDRENEARLEEWYADPQVFGARAVFAKRSQSWLRDGTADWFWPVAERLSMPVMVFAPGQYREVEQVAQRHPNLKLAICHLGMDTALRDEEIVPQVEQVLALAEYPNIAVKATSLPSYTTEPFPFPTLQEHIRRVVEAFGPRRVFWGSDLSRLRCDYRELYQLFAQELDFLSDTDKEWIMGRGLCEWFGWEIGPDGSGR
jgi:predicted TIM-barrel fold metal-dependent hydrolase